MGVFIFALSFLDFVLVAAVVPAALELRRSRRHSAFHQTMRNRGTKLISEGKDFLRRRPMRNWRGNIIKNPNSVSVCVATRSLARARRGCSSTTGWLLEPKLRARRRLLPGSVPRSIEA